MKKGDAHKIRKYNISCLLRIHFQNSVKTHVFLLEFNGVKMTMTLFTRQGDTDEAIQNNVK